MRELVKDIVIFVLGMNAGVGFLYLINKTIRAEISKYLLKIDDEIL